MNRIITSLIACALPLLLVSTVSLSNAARPFNKNQSWNVKYSIEPELRVLDEVVRSDHPSQLFGFNINFKQFQKQLWTKDQLPKTGIVEALQPFEGAIYRYPGGLVANSFHWKASVGPVVSRTAQTSFFQKSPAKVRFGLEEYLQFVDDVSGQPWYVLNIVGTDLVSPLKVSPKDEMAYSNLNLAKYLAENLDKKYFPMRLQLGNELDRSKYEWLGEKYARRAKSVMDIIKANRLEDEFEFVNFMRDFTWTYRRDTKLGRSNPKDYLKEVIDTMGVTNDYSLHHYYDGNRIDGNSRAIPFWLRHLSRSIDDHLDITGEPASIWITEHGRQPNSKKAGTDGSEAFTSNVSAALSTSDYLISLTQFAEVKGAVWHGLNAGPWQLFDYSVKHRDLRPRPIYWALRVLRMVSMDEVLRTFTYSPNNSEYAGGYDIRGTAFRTKDENQFGLRLVNRAPAAQKIKVKYELFTEQKVSYKQYSLSLKDGQDPDVERDDFIVEIEPAAQTDQFDDKGYISIELPASSVSSIVMQKSS